MDCFRRQAGQNKSAASLLLLAIVLFFPPTSVLAQAPTPADIVIAIEENHDYSQIIGSAAAPYINSLVAGTNAALFTQSYGLTHPSQPNYVMLFSGSNQGVTNDNRPSTLPFTALNLGASLIDSGKTFAGYSEDLPYVGYDGNSSGAYARKHNPWTNWQSAPVNGIPPAANQPLTSFPANYNSLPAVSFVVPNQNNDMHNGSDPTRITTGDTWLQNHLDAYIQWAKTHNSLFILTFDEGTTSGSNHIVTLFVGQMVAPGQYSETVNHYGILRTIEEMYGLPHAGNSSTASPITDCWIAVHTITATAGPYGSLSPNGAVTVTQGANQAFNIIQNTGFHVDSVFVDGSHIGAPSSYEFTSVISTHTISATFAINQYTITASAGANGSISPSGTTIATYGSSQTFTITPSPAYVIATLTVDGLPATPDSSYSFTSIAANHTITATFSLVPIIRQIAVVNGWNLVSLPVTVSNRTKAALFPGAISNAYAFGTSTGYVQQDTLQYGVGYWLKFGAAENVSIAGSPITIDSVSVFAGWNVLGSISSPVVADSIIQLPSGIVTTGYYAYTGAYAPADTLFPGEAYWVKVNSGGVLVLRP